MLENRYYAIPIFSNEWWVNNIITLLFVISFLFIAKFLCKKDYSKTFNYSIGIILLLRVLWNQCYQYQLGQWNAEWSLPIQMCSFSSIFSGTMLIFHNLKIKKEYKLLVFEFLLYWSIGAFYAFLTPVYTTGREGFIYYDYYVSHGGILFVILYCQLILGYSPRKKSWLKIFLYSQPILLVIHIINILIGGDANYFYTLNPPIANNPLIIGTYPTHIILLDIFAGIHFYVIYLLLYRKTNYLKLD